MKKKMISGVAVIAFCAALISATTPNTITTSATHEFIVKDTMPDNMHKSDTSMNRHKNNSRNKMNDSSNQWRDSSQPMMSKDSTSH